MDYYYKRKVNILHYISMAWDHLCVVLTIKVCPYCKIILPSSGFIKNKLAPNQKAVAMGEATGQSLDKLKIKNYVLPPTFDDLGLVMMVSR